MTKPVPAGNSPLAALMSGEPISTLETKRSALRVLVNQLEDVIAEAEERAERVAARRHRRAERLGSNSRGRGGDDIGPDTGRNTHLPIHDPHSDGSPTESWKG